MKPSVLILTCNEEACIQRCINSVDWSDDIVILDSFSTDKTVSIINRNKDVRLHKLQFIDFATQRNYGLHNIKFKNNFVLLLDADETCTNELMNEIFKISDDDCHHISTFNIKRKLFYKNKWLRHNTMYPVWIGRLVKPMQVIFKGEVHEKLVVDGNIGYLKNHIDHFPFDKGLDHWLQRRIVYSNLMIEKEINEFKKIKFTHLFSNNPIMRRKNMNIIFRKLPLRWMFFFFYNFFIKCAFLDGARGIEHLMLETFYEYISFIKITNNPK